MITICPNAVGRRENTTQVGMSKQTRMKNTRSLARGVWRQGWEGCPQLDIIRSASVSFFVFLFGGLQEGCADIREAMDASRLGREHLQGQENDSEPRSDPAPSARDAPMWRPPMGKGTSDKFLHRDSAS